MTINSQRYLTDYAQWLSSPNHAPDLGVIIEINSPCLDRNSDYIQLYVRQSPAGVFTISDDQYTLDDLQSCGCEFTPARKAMLEYLTRRAGISIENTGNLTVSCAEAELAQKKHDLIQTILTVNDMFYSYDTATCFNSVIAKWLVDKNVPFISDYKIEGVSGLDNFFDIIIPASRQGSERFIFITNCVSETSINNIVYLWQDITPTRTPGSECFVIVNDENSLYLENNSGYVAGLDYEKELAGRGIKIIPWSQREAFLPELLK